MSQILMFWPVVTATLAAIALAAIQVGRDTSRQRAEDLRLVQRALEAHYRAVDVLVDDPATTPEMLKSVQLINRVMGDKEFVDFFFANGGGETLPSPGRLSGNAVTAFSQADKLSASRPDLVAAFHAAVSNAITVLYLRWPGRSAAYRDFLAGAYTEPKEEAAVAGKILDLGFKKTRRDDSDVMPGAAMA